MSISPEAQMILRALTEKSNVLLSGPPSCGKTHLMQEVADAFMAAGSTSAPPGPISSSGRIAIPAKVPIAGPLPFMPSGARTSRHVERIAFSANTKARDFTSAFVPKVGGAAAGGLMFAVETGALLKANKAAIAGGAALLLIDEMNRGPAVQLFGDAIVAIESDKRLDASDLPTRNSWPMRILDASGASGLMYLSAHLYILASVNMADSSIEPLDVAFLRRFQTISIHPDAVFARKALGALGAGAALPVVPTNQAEVSELAIRAWEAVNDRIAIGRSPDFQLGHGVFLDRPKPANLQDALRQAVEVWQKVYVHIREVFYGDLVGVGIALNAATDTSASAGYRIANAPYGLDERQRILEPVVDTTSIYGVLKQVAGA